MSICAPACVPLPKLSCTPPALLICGAKPKCTPRSTPPSLPFASNVANAGNKPVRIADAFWPSPVGTSPPANEQGAVPPAPVATTVLHVGSVYTRNAFTLPENEKFQPLLICIVSPCALAVPAAIASAHVTIAILFMLASPRLVKNERQGPRKNSSANESFDLEEIGTTPSYVFPSPEFLMPPPRERECAASGAIQCDFS